MQDRRRSAQPDRPGTKKVDRPGQVITPIYFVWAGIAAPVAQAPLAATPLRLYGASRGLRRIASGRAGPWGGLS